MGNVDVSADGEHRYAAVLTTAGGRRSEHVVVSDPLLLERLQVTDTEEPFLVRRVLELLVGAADSAEAEGDRPAVPGVIDLTALDRERPELLPSVALH